MSDYEVVIGLEVHVQLATRTKLFSPAAVSYGDPPNHHVTPVCLALPGALPVLNGRAVELAVRAGLATGCTIHSTSVFARKNYFYPDLPKGYQISQFEEPLATDGALEIEVEGPDGELFTRRVGITRIHMEEDAGKSLHEESADDTLIDLNRAGVPLIEVVSEPDLRSPAEATAYLRKLHAILRAVGASDADLEKGQFRCDANISLRRRGESELGTRTEIKNVNSFRFVQAALENEIDRQAAVLDEGGAIRQATLGYDAERDRLFVMRIKENADDYRYFPDPDLVPLVIPEARIEEIRAALPELPEARRRRLARDYAIPEADALKLVATASLADFFERTVEQGAPPLLAARWLCREVLAWLKERDREIDQEPATPESLAALFVLVAEGRLTAKSARDLLGELLGRGGDPRELMRERGLEAVSDEGELEEVVDRVLAAEPEAVASYRGGDSKPLNFLMGQVMRQTQGKADPGRVRSILSRKLEEG